MQAPPPRAVPRTSYPVPRVARGLALGALALAVALAGCLPSSQRQNTRAMAPADSAAAALAEAVPVDTLAEAWTLPIGEAAQVPTGIAWVQPDSAFAARLAVVDTRLGQILTVSAGGERGPTWTLGEDRFPYLAGVAGDTVVVLSRGGPALEWATARGVARSVPAPEGATAAYVGGGRRVVRLGGGPSETPPALVELDARGEVTARHPLRTGWRASGFVRPWGDSLLALSGYRPVADVLPPEASGGRASGAGGRAPLDTLAFRGFVSPQLVRSYQFMIGEVDEPPLLSPAAQALGDRLYVLNLRAEAIRVDVYSRAGRLVRVMETRSPTDPEGRPTTLDVYPADLAVRFGALGEIEIAVLLRRDRGIFQGADARVALFRALPEAPAPEASGGGNGAAPADSAGRAR